MRACGGHVVDFTWKDGKITDYKIRSKTPGKVQDRIAGELKTIITNAKNAQAFYTNINLAPDFFIGNPGFAPQP